MYRQMSRCSSFWFILNNINLHPTLLSFTWVSRSLKFSIFRLWENWYNRTKFTWNTLLNLHKIVFPKSLCLSNDHTVLSRFVYISTCMCTVCKVSSILLVAILIKHMMARLVSLIVTTPHWQVHLERGVYLCLCHTSMLHFN